ncbi:MAG: hypothetical protein KAU07_03435, partial [Candidatus Andersenbacteria bacterium]|nr:hypothetical protein [Candidatus Andersenbacteria bacterium]
MNKKNKKIPKNPIKNDLVRNLLTIILLFVFMASIFTLFDISEEKPEEISMSKLAQQVEEGKVKEIIAKEGKNRVEVILNDENETKQTVLKGGITSLEDELINVYKIDK